MELRTTFGIEPSERKITYNDPVMFIGSCFATSIGRQFELGRMPVMVNPSGTVYNPVSVCNTINSVTEKKIYTYGDLYNYQGSWVSFDHYSDFSSSDRDAILEKINRRSAEALKFISTAGFLFITFGTARVYRWIRSGRIVSNCHKIPSSEFTHELLTVDGITALWIQQLDRLKSLFPGLQVVFTISPVRHWKDGAHGNQISKSCPVYFPAYELVMDDLRDYRFYDDDMLHISEPSVKYIWDAFCKCYFNKTTTDLWHEVSKISRALLHNVNNNDRDQIRNFAENMISRISAISRRNPGINFEKEKKYFQDLLEDQKDRMNT